MPLSAGTMLGPYQILSPLGKGGMGEVYRAKDTKLDREIAIKVLPDSLARDPERLARFEREAKVLASLNHPAIATIYGLETSPAGKAIAMELVDGAMLKSPLPLNDALRIATQIAEALEAAHEKGITHRDLKPANVMVTEAGLVKVLDFGLAAIGRAASASGEDSPTVTQAMTGAGVILGTAAYMSPEQAAGKPADKRSDVWSFGVVLYEMLTGKRLFRGETISHIMADVLRAPIDFSQVNAPVPIRELLKRCLDRDLKTRLQAIGEARIAIEKYLADPSPAVEQQAVSSSAGRGWTSMLAAVLAVTTVALGVTLWAPWRAAPELPRPMRFQIAPPPGVNLGAGFSLSPDGIKLAYVGSGTDGVQRLWVRSMDTLESHGLAGTEGLSGAPPFWSPDSRYIAFHAEGKLKKVIVAGGTPQTICDVTGTVVGGSWNRDGVILIGTISDASGIYRVASGGGAPSPVTSLNAERKDMSHLFPVFLPDGRHFLYFVYAGENIGIYLGSLESKPNQQEPKRLLATAFGAGFVPFPDGKQGAILFQRDGTLLAQPFDLRRLETTGESVPVAEQVGSYIAFGYFAASLNGTLAYRGGTEGSRRLTVQWLDSADKTQPLLAKPGVYTRQRLSPDGQRLVLEILEGSKNDLWIYEWQRDNMMRLTFDARTQNMNPAWSADGRYIVFTTSEGISWTRSDGAGKPQPLTRSKNYQFPGSFTQDGKRLVWAERENGRMHLSTMPVENDGTGLRGGKPEVFLQTSFNEQQPMFSPDGRWLAYASDESGAFQVYVRAFPDRGGKWQMSYAGGSFPVWSQNRRELFFRSNDGLIMVASYTLKGDSILPDKPRVWSEKRIASYDLAPDGKRIAALIPVETPEGQAQNRVVVLLNLLDELRRKMPVSGK